MTRGQYVDPISHFEWLIRLCVIWQSYIMVVLAIGTLILLWRRNRHTKKMAELSERWELWILDIMLESRKDEKLYVPFTTPPTPLERASLREIVVKHLRLLKGAEREVLIGIYKANQFVTDDLVDSHSVFWPTRLKAVYNLGSLNRPLLAPQFRRLAQDPNELVSVAALLCLSQTEVPLDEARHWLTHLPHCLQERRAVLFQLMSNFSHQHGPQILWINLLNTKDAWIRETAIEVLLTLKSPDAMTTVEDLLKSKVGLTDSDKRRLTSLLEKSAA